MSTMSKRLFWISLLCTLGAVATHIYLTNHHYEFKYGQGGSGGICNISSTVNCDITTASAYSEFLGIPISIFGGLVNFALLLIMLAWRFPLVSRETQKNLNGPLRLITLAIFAVSVVMGVISYVMLKTICPACTTTYVLSLVTLAATWAMTEKTALFSVADIKLYGMIGLSTLAFAFFINKNSMASYNVEEQMEMMDLQLEQWINSSERNFTPAEPLVKNPNPSAKVKMVEFADFLCGHCAFAFPVIKGFLDKHPDVEFSFQAWPLDGECNKAIPHATGIQCLLARVSHCAGKQDKAWETQEWLFANQRSLMSKEQIEAQLKESAPSLQLNFEELWTCSDSEEAREAIRQQANVGIDLNITGTPSLFINGKKVPSGFKEPLLNKIYKQITK